MDLITLGILGLCAAGLFYSALAWQRRVAAEHKSPPYEGRFSVFETHYASVGPIPNGALGVGLYGLVACAVLVVPALEPLALVAVVGATAYGLYLLYVLRRILHKHCKICYTAHAINFALLAVLLVRRAG